MSCIAETHLSIHPLPHTRFLRLVALLLWLLLSAGSLGAQTTAFTYQGRLTDTGGPASGNFDLQFKLFDTGTVGTGTQQGSTVVVSNVTVTAGVFTVQLDFGAGVFPGASRFLEIAVKPTSGATFTVLGPRQAVTATPYAIKSANATAADSLSTSCVNCVTSGQIQSLPTGSGFYIQNTNSLQSPSNFNISGNGTAGGTLGAGTVNATTQYNLGGIRILSAGGTNNLFAGLGAGQTNTVGSNNAFFGFNAGAANTGDVNDTNVGIDNAFFGASAGEANKFSRNAFFGSKAGQANTTGGGNAFFGHRAGSLNTNGSNNSFFGFYAGVSSTGGQNSFFGEQAGNSNLSGAYNAFFGEVAGFSNTTGSYNTMIGTDADVGSNNLTNATAIGANARVDQSNSLVLGSIAGVSGAAASVSVGIGTTTPQARLHVKGDILLETSSGNFIQFHTPNSETGLSIIKGTSRADLRFDGLVLKLVATAGPGIPAPASGIAITTAGSVGIGTTSPFLNTKLDIVGGLLRLDQLAGGGDENLCRHSVFHTIATCNSSSLRYKEGVQPLRQGLQLIQRLRPVTFSWKEGGREDLGLIAEEVAKVEPLLTFKNDKGEIEGVKYPQLNVVLINAVKEQQARIETLEMANAVLYARLRAVERVLRKRTGGARRRH